LLRRATRTAQLDAAESPKNILGWFQCSEEQQGSRNKAAVKNIQTALVFQCSEEQQGSCNNEMYTEADIKEGFQCSEEQQGSRNQNKID